MRRRRVATQTVAASWWSQGESVTIKGFTAQDQQWVQDAAMLLKSDSESNAELRVLAGTSQLCSLLRGIVSMTLVSEQGIGYPWPPLLDAQGEIIAENLKVRKAVLNNPEFMPEDQEFIAGKIAELNNLKSKEEQEAFLESVAAGSVASQAQPQTLQLTAT
jgi:hypothetical protein